MDIATEALQLATESLRRAEDRRNAFMDANPSDFTSAGYLALSAEVTSCRAVAIAAHNTLAAQNLSSRSSIISCISQSISGRCSTGRHTDRNKGIQKSFRKKLVKRNTGCTATGSTDGVVAAHIVPLNKSQKIASDILFSPAMVFFFATTLKMIMTDTCGYLITTEM